jgi:para-aminobenzoate synthetase component I
LDWINDSITINVRDPKRFFFKSLRFASKFSHFLALYSDPATYPLGGFKKKIFMGCQKSIVSKPGMEFFKELKKRGIGNHFLVGYMGYDLKNQMENLDSQNEDLLEFPDGQFFIPEIILEFEGNSLKISSTEPSKKIVHEIEKVSILENPIPTPQLKFKGNFSRDRYIETVNRIRSNIRKGDIYELNLSQNFVTESKDFPYVDFFTSMSEINPVPFSALLKINSLVLIGSSPERFLKKQGEKIWSQPMKGTRPRASSHFDDEKMRQELGASEKEIAENMMIMDLVRNDLAKSCLTGSINVEEMFKIYPFKTVFQMITTVSGRLVDPSDPIFPIMTSFPMGSMTGAPKIKAMELIEFYETRKRGLYSGALGYFNPDGDFDLAVNIRSLIYHRSRSILSYHVGGAITWDSIPEKEYEECLWKAAHFDRLFKKTN